MDSVLRSYVIATVAAVLVYLAAFIIFFDVAEDIMVLICIALFPVSAMGLYIFLEGRGERWVNGMDWVSMDEKSRRNALSYMGKYLVAGMVMLSIAISVILASLIVGIVLIILSTAIIIVPVARVEKAMDTQFVERGKGTKALAFIVVSVLCIAPSMAIAGMDFTTDSITVEFQEDGIYIKGPMYSGLYEYDSIEQLEYDPDFDKGSRQIGYGTPTISCGKFKNYEFGSYYLYSYTQVKPCAFFLYDGTYRAFNLSDEQQTWAAYKQLRSLVEG